MSLQDIDIDRDTDIDTDVTVLTVNVLRFTRFLDWTSGPKCQTGQPH